MCRSQQARRSLRFVAISILLLAATWAAACGGGASGGTPSSPSSPTPNPTPAVTSISPASITTADVGSTVTINGTGFVPASAVMWNGASHPSIYVSSTQLQFTLLPADVASTGTVQVSVVNPAPGGGSAPVPQAIAIVYPAPVITALLPSAVAAGNPAFVLTISGKGFLPTSAVQLNGSPRVATYLDSNTLTIPVSASDVTAPASLPITVINPAPGGGTSAPANLTVSPYVTPAITTVFPTSILVNSGDSAANLIGSGFTAATTVQVNGNTVPSNGYYAPYLSFTIPASYVTSVGTLSITASNPGNLVSAPVTIDVIPNPVPTLSGLSAYSAAIGSPDLTLTLNGGNFIPSSVVQWNGSPRPTTLASGQLTATIFAKDLATLGSNNVTVFNPAPGGGTSAPLTFSTYIGLAANDLVYSSSTNLLYASVPSIAGTTYGNSIVPIDPYTGALGTPIFVGSEPGKLALSSDGATLWVSLTGVGAVREVNLNTRTAGIQFGLGGGIGVYNPPNQVQALAVMPGHANTIAIAAPTTIPYSSSLTIYDSGVPRPNVENSPLPCCSGVVAMAFDPTGTKLYQAGGGYGVATVDSTGITSSAVLNSTVFVSDMRVDNGRAYLTTGTVLDANTGTQLGVFSVAPNATASGPVAPDSTLGDAFVITAASFQSPYQIYVYDTATFLQKGSIPLGLNPNYYPQAPKSLTRWGQDGLAYTYGAQIYILRSTLVRDLSTSLADLNVSVTAPTVGTTGTNLTYSVKVKNNGPVTAAPAVLTDYLPDGVALQSVTTGQGSCVNGAVVICDLGNLASGASATVQITTTPLSPGTAINTASVAAPQGDPNAADNTLVSNTSITGSVYTAVPALISISPDFVQTGSPSFTLTVAGSGFASNSTVNLNGSPLSTTFVNGSSLTATVDASNVSSLGWSSITVSNPAPGGGLSGSLPLTTYLAVSLDVNRMAFDPYTRKIYATVPSTAPQVAGNSLVSIDPNTGSMTPFGIGSEPNRLAESSDGKYMYVGLDGSKSVTRVDLNAFTQGLVYPLSTTNFGQNVQVTAGDLAVAPGNDNLLAIDTYTSGSGIGLFDISGSTGTFRPNMTGFYTGSTPTFVDGSTLYSYDSDTTGAEFYRWSVTASGLTLNNNTGYTINGIGGFSGSFKLANGILYGFGGGVADPSTTPPQQLGQFYYTSAPLPGSGLAPDPAAGRIFYVAPIFPGGPTTVVLAYDPNTFLLLDSKEVPGIQSQGIDLVRWGRDGLAWHSAANSLFGNPSVGDGKVYITRGPFVLPYWNRINAVPGLTSASPSNATAGSGNLLITITGSGFVPGAVLTWNGSERTTTFVDSSHLTVAIPASDLAHAGTATLAVNNPNSHNSTTISFTIN